MATKKPVAAVLMKSKGTGMGVAPAPWTTKLDDKADKKAGIKDGSKKDSALDKMRGVPDMPSKAGAKGNFRGK